ncbi:hypothetical protein OIO90_001356 [Microbotryomycetes sp. JL221]|nr:hypothetical protein OIO90_001356 [Microbotryomycetes sp. JL221]
MSALLTVTIRQDLQLTNNEVLNSNIVAGVASLLVRLFAGFLCERYGPRKVLCAILWASALPCGLAGTISGPVGLYFIRFFMGIAGGSFVPAQVWVTAHFDKRVLGTSTACAAGWGDSGVGFTFFIMPAVFESFLRHHNHEPRVAWRLSFIVPCVLLLAVSVVCLTLCDDTPTGPWHDRPIPSPNGSFSTCSTSSTGEREQDGIERGERQFNDHNSSRLNRITQSRNSSVTFFDGALDGTGKVTGTAKDSKGVRTRVDALESRRGSAVSTMTETSDPELGTFSSNETKDTPFKQGLKDVVCWPTFLLASMYFTTFGTCLVINSFLVPWYLNTFPQWDEGKAGHWAAMVGLLNIVSRPFGGLVADVIYRQAIKSNDLRGLRGKQYWLCLLCIVQGVFGVWIGVGNPKSMGTLLGGIAGYAFFMQAANGACYALLPHVNSHVNGLMGGAVGSSGNLGGIVYSIIYRYTSIPQTLYITGACSIAIGLIVSIIHPVPRKQRHQTDDSSA